jgi:hypothetical protein
MLAERNVSGPWIYTPPRAGNARSRGRDDAFEARDDGCARR